VLLARDVYVTPVPTIHSEVTFFGLPERAEDVDADCDGVRDRKDNRALHPSPSP
jgi:hypothetical protein